MNPNRSSILRTILKLVGSSLATYGAIDASEVANLVNLAEVFFGAAFALWGSIWSIWSKRPSSKEAKQITAATIVAGVPMAAEIAEAQKLDP